MSVKSSRVTISLPTALLRAADAKLTRPDETRSALIQRLVRQALREAREREEEAAFIRSYTEMPSDPERDGIWTTWLPDALLEEMPWHEE